MMRNEMQHKTAHGTLELACDLCIFSWESSHEMEWGSFRSVELKCVF